MKVDLCLDLDAVEVVLGFDDVVRIRASMQKRFDADGMLCVSASEHRSQFQNYEAAMERMRNLIAAALVRQKRRIATRPTRGSRHRRLEAKKHRGEIKRGRQRGSGPD
jgi:ribosome-associated protein